MEDNYLTKRELLVRLQVSLSTVNRWIKDGTGPPHMKLGRLVRFRESDVDNWLAQQNTNAEDT
jgi:excisionase family DNA binding protein